MSKPKAKIAIIAGARPNFMKIAPIIRELQLHQDLFEWRLVHTGQHYDRQMSDVFFDELGIPKPDYHLDVGSGSHAEQTAKIMLRFEEVCAKEPPHLVLVVGDVNSTLACSIVAKKLNIAVAHVEAGLRSGDMSMPEEVNRIVTDSISDYFFVTEPEGVQNLTKEGHAQDKIHFVGHVMVDNLYHQLALLQQIDPQQYQTNKLKKQLGRYGVLTLHRPANVDDQRNLREIFSAINEISLELPIVFPIHPRTDARIKEFGIELSPNIIKSTSLPYMEFLNLWKDAAVVLTDSGGLQEETTALGVPCVTIRENTERPITATQGTNVLAGTKHDGIVKAARMQLSTNSKVGHKPDLWDGDAAKRIVLILKRMAPASSR